MTEPRGRSQECDQLLGLLRSGRSALVTGSMGVGKTALLHHVARLLRSEGFTVTEVAATAAASTIPFGALTGFIDPLEQRAPAALMGSACDRLGRLASTGRSVVFIDDAQHLDVATIAVIHRVVTTTDTVVMASLRSSDPAPAQLRDLWRHADVVRFELEPLDQHTTREMVAAQLGDVASAPEVADIAQRSAGNPLFARELVQARLDGTPTGLTAHLVDLVDQRIDALDPAAQEQMTIIAIGQPLDISLDIVDIAVVARLERAGLVVTEAADRGFTARPAHPLHAEVIRTRLTPIERRALSKRLGAALMEQPIRRRGDALRIVNWLLEAGDRPPPELSEAAAFEAIGWLDADLADRLATMAVEDHRSARSLFALGEIRRLSGRSTEAAAIWEGAFELATEDDDVRRIALALSQFYDLFLRDYGRTIDILTRAKARITEPSMRLGVEADLAMTVSRDNRHDSLVALEAVLDDPDCGDEAAWTALCNLLWVRATSLDLAGVDRQLQRAADVEHRLPADRDGEVDLIHALTSNIILSRSGPAAALGAALEYRDDAHRRGIACGITEFTISQMQQLTGDLGSAVRSATAALSEIDGFDAFNAGPMIGWQASIVAHHAGQPELAVRLFDAATHRAAGVAPWQAVWFPRASAWRARSSGRIGEAIQHLRGAGMDALRDGEAGWGVLCFHDAVVWGAADEVVHELRRVRLHVTDVDALQPIFDHAEAVHRGDLDALTAVAIAFESLGARWYSAAAWANRAVLATDPVERCRSATRALLMSGPYGLHPGAPSLALSQRQLDVARQASGGSTSRGVAEALFLSTRTVDNHLRSVYRRLGVDGRDELAAVIGHHHPPAVSPTDSIE